MLPYLAVDVLIASGFVLMENGFDVFRSVHNAESIDSCFLLS